MDQAEVGIVGGTGLYRMPGVEGAREVEVGTPFGAPSSPIVLGRLAGRRVAFLARHGRAHDRLPTEIPYQANVYALRALGVRQVLSVSAVGSLREDLPPRRFVVIDQLIDRVRRRPLTFFGDGLVAHVGFGDPFCRGLRGALLEGAAAARLDAAPRGTYLQMEGPQFSTRAESVLYRSWGCDVIGMTNGSEARLAREAEVCYATLAFVTDYDAWRPHAASVETSEILAVIRDSADAAARVLAEAVARLPSGDCACRHALAQAFVTPPSQVPAATRERLRAILAPYLGGAPGGGSVPAHGP
jgi:5'-methylthioadenosine phosphorylase